LATGAGPAPEPGIVHLGLGNFARAHTAVYTAGALAVQPGPWGVVGVAQRSHAVADALLAQDLLYAVLTLAPGTVDVAIPTVLSCDNLEGNGDHTGRLVHEFVDALPAAEREELAGYLAGAVSFPSTMVDRIVPATTPAHRRLAAERLGVADEVPVPTERFSMWVLQDRFAAGR